MAYTQGSSIKKILIDGVLHPVNDFRVEGTKFAVTQIAGDITIDTPITADQLAHISEAVISEDGCVINVPALGTILIPKDVKLDPAATDDYVLSYVSSPLDGKTYNFKVTIDHTTGLPKEAVFAEEEVASPPANILETKLDTYKTEFAKPVADRDPAIVAEAKAFGTDVLGKKANIIVVLDADNQPVGVYHATESPDPTAYFRYANDKNECIDIYFTVDPITGAKTVSDMAFPELENIYVEKTKEYMEINTTVNHVVYEKTKPIMLDEETLGFSTVEEVSQAQGTNGIIHYPKSVLFTSNNAFTLSWKSAGSYFVYGNLAEYSVDGINWSTVGNDAPAATLVANTLNSELGKYSMFVRSDRSPDATSGVGKFEVNSGSNIEISGVLEALWGCKKDRFFNCYRAFYNQAGFSSAKNLIFPNYTRSNCYEQMFNKSGLITPPVILPATTLEEGCYLGMFSSCHSLTSCPLLPAKTLAKYCYREMFAWDENVLNTAQIPATVLGVGCCIDMYTGCNSLTKATIPPATTLKESCYNHMYMNCIALEEAPELPATTLDTSCYTEMFKGCVALKRAPELPATVLKENCYNGMFYGCTLITTVPKLLSTSLAAKCYQNMFYNCTSLRQLQQSTLPATDLPQACYSYMFYNTRVPILTLPTISSIETDVMRHMYSGDKRIKWGATGEPFMIETTDGSVSQEYTTNMFVNNLGTIPEGDGSVKLNTTYYYTIVN